MLNKIIKFFLENRLVTVLVVISFIFAGIVTSPFGWQLGSLPSSPIPVDAIPDIGENQQIVFTTWDGRSPQDIEDQITYPLTTYLLGIPGVSTIRSSSILGFSSIYIIFEDDIEFYWSRSRIIEKLNSLPSGLLPDDAHPTLGPDATALGQVYWYTIEGRDKNGNSTGGWDLHEIRTVQDFYIKYGLNGAEGVSEVASIGGFVQEYQIDIFPEAMKAFNISLSDVITSIKNSNRDVGAGTVEINQVEYSIRGLGYIKSLDDINEALVKINGSTPIKIKDIAKVTLGPAERRGMLDKDGAEVVGGVVVARHGANPLEVINNIKKKIDEISPGLPSKTLENGDESKLTIVPFYDRSELIYETLGTLEEALSLQVLITILVIIVMIYNLQASMLISSLLPIAILMVFIAMRFFNIDANIVALSGIAIAIGTLVDLGIILSENVIKHIDEAPKEQNLLTTIYNGATEVGSAILTAVSTTIISFIPVFTLQAAEGKLFTPLAFTKTFALIAALIVTLIILPTFAYWFFGLKVKNKRVKQVITSLIFISGVIGLFSGNILPGILLILFASASYFKNYLSAITENSHKLIRSGIDKIELIIVIFGVVAFLAKYWLPLGAGKSIVSNFIFVALIVSIVLGAFSFIHFSYKKILTWILDNKVKFLIIPSIIILLGTTIWLGFSSIFGFIPNAGDKVGLNLRQNRLWSTLSHSFSGLKKEFMPSLDEGSFLLMPTSMPHSGMEFNRVVVGQLDMLISQIPEVELTVGKMGRVESALDPAPISMYENVINYKSEYALDEKGHKIRFKVDKKGSFILKSGETISQDDALENGISISELEQDKRGKYFRNWRSHINSADDIWNEIVKVTKIPGVTSAPKLQPIETRLVMLQTGMRAPMGIKVFGPDLQTIEDFGIELENILKTSHSIKSEATFADRIVGKPYIHLNIKRDEIARYGLNIEDIQQVIETSIGGIQLSTTVEGRQRFPIRVRYPREMRANPDELGNILITTNSGAQIPLKQVVEIEYVKGAQAINSENTFLVGHVIFDKAKGLSEVQAVNDAQYLLNSKIASGELIVPAGVSYVFSGSYENQVRAEKRLSIIVPIVLIIIFLILYFQFKSTTTSLMIFTGIFMAFSGGLIMLWLYGQDWFLNFSLFSINLRDIFQIREVNLSIAVWVGFIALFGLATDDGVLIGTYLDQSFERNKPTTISDIRKSVIEAGERRIRPAVMTSTTTIIALLPVLTSSGRGSDIMIPMAIPAFGGMIMAAITYYIVPTLYAIKEEQKLKRRVK